MGFLHKLYKVLLYSCLLMKKDTAVFAAPFGIVLPCYFYAERNCSSLLYASDRMYNLPFSPALICVFNYRFGTEKNIHALKSRANFPTNQIKITPEF